MNRFTKLLGAVALLGISLAACEETTPPPPVGSIVGQVSIEGTGIDGVSVNLSNGNTTTTAGGGSYRFDNVEGGAYTVTISGFPSDATFDATSAAATISSAGQSVTLNFTGAYIRTASVMGSVTVENMGLGGVTVALSGVSSQSAVTGDDGQYTFTGLRMGNYSVEISGFDSDEVGFSNTAAAVMVGVGESKIISFDGTYLRTAGIMGRVSVEGEGLEGVTVSLAGGPDNTDMTTMTDAAGQYNFSKLRAGDYAVGISGYNTDDYEFEVTSQNVTVALGETANIPFEGVLLRTAGVSGRVSVEGIGLADVMVTLSMADADDATAMTDAGGLYAFSGLAAGDYTVAIALSDEQMAAYVFDMTNMDVTLEDDMTSVVNFEAEHAATASVTVKLFVDEAMKNDMYDEGEGTFPTEAMLAMVAELGLPLALPISLAGPGVHDMQSGTAMPDGSVVFAGLKAGQYQVIVSDIPAATLAALPPALAHVLRDYAYGGPAAGYPIDLAVGQEAIQHAPIDITHTTVHFGVALQHGETRGDALPGATVTLYADAMGETKITDAMTDSMGMAAIRIARAGTSGNMVHAGVSAADDYTVGEGTQAVSWDPQKTHTMAANDNDIVNLNVDATVSGATKTTEYGGGKALAGWAISVMMGDSAVADAPEALDEEGNAAFKTAVGMDALPATFTVALADDQDNKLDGGESVDADDVEYVHTGLSLAGTVDAGVLEAAYTTQTLKVYVHHELDQVEGYTGNINAGDAKDGKGDARKVDVEIRYINENGRSRPFADADSIKTSRTNGDGGAWVFSNVPADMNVIATASKRDNTDDGIIILDEGGHADELAAYTGTEANGIMGGHFGEQGGYSHTVSLCPLQAVDPSGQDHGECSSFAYVSTHSVSGLVWKAEVVRDGDDFKINDPKFVPESTVSLAPVEGKNLAGEDQSHTTTEKPVRTAGETAKGTEVLDETHQFAFNDISAGVYTLSVPDGWRARMGEKGADAMVGNALNPLAGDVVLDVTPATTTVYGFAVNERGHAADSVVVTVNGVEAVSDVHGRYIAEYVPSASNKRGTEANPNTIAVTTAHAGSAKTDSVFAFAANTPFQVDVRVSGVGATASVSGRVTASGTGAPVAGAAIWIDGEKPSNAATRGANAGKLVTGADGTYTAMFGAKPLGQDAEVTVTRDGMSFAPTALSVPAHAGSAISGITFTGFLHATITGSVSGPDGRAMAGVVVTATQGDAAAADTDTTNARGAFWLSVPFGTYTITATLNSYTFVYPGQGQSRSTAPGQNLDFGTIAAATFAALNVRAVRQRTADDDTTADVDESERFDGQIRVSWDANDSTAVPEGYDEVAYVVQDNADTSVGFDAAGATAAVDTAGLARFASPADTAFMVRIVATATDTDASGEGGTTLDPIVINSAMVTVGAIDPSASGVTARRGATADTTVADTLTVTWDADSNTNSEFRIMVEVASENTGSTLWLVASGGEPATIGNTTRSWSLGWIHDFTASWNTVGGAAIPITDVELNKPFRVRVDSRQGSTGDFTEGTPVSVPVPSS